ncbi:MULTISPECIES: hypothetical protein [Achromobacter]|uniref:N-acetyltransferase YedL n=1 Tax=Achromobacter spanius TaxID=217203 RepID=A0ABY8GXC9_9BURK|nr:MULTISPECIES: hypothetical protein [Achromobacter]WAI81258.1 hypothetical protein N8Z00_17090 [Achromobacter spanius]WEX96776.1 hypothetical protein N3Z32_11695 [Achromobacter sp. SS2-2022]WFP09509.1 hypothetical protein P8T11_06415 [Achromobacter spanius]
MNVRPMHTKRLAASLCAAGLMLAAGAVHAADAIGRAAIQSQYEQDVANCKSGKSNQDRATCMREAGAARQEANRQNLKEGSTADYQQNMLDRCNRLPTTSRQDCITQMTSPTNVRGSVQGGGVLRETVIQVPAGTVPPSTTMPPPTAPAQGMAPPPATTGTPMRQ